jgi:hypothetical protein
MRLKLFIAICLIVGWSSTILATPLAGQMTASHLERICDPLGRGLGQTTANQYQCFGYIAAVFDAYMLARQLKGKQTEYCPENIYQYGATVSNLWAVATPEEKKLPADQFVMLMLKHTDAKCKNAQAQENMHNYGEGTERLAYRCRGQPTPYEIRFCSNYMQGVLDYFNTMSVKNSGRPIFCVQYYEDNPVSAQMIEIYKANLSDPSSRKAIFTLVQVFEKWHSCNTQHTEP